MTSITAAQHTALLDALDALRDKHLAACRRGDLQSADHLFTQYGVVRDLIDRATIEAGDAPTPDAPPLWRDSDREEGMRDGTIRLGLAAAPYVTVSMRGGGMFVLIDDDDETVGVRYKHLPALIAMLQEVQRRIEAGDAL